MLSTTQWSIFFTATIVLLIVPGPSVIYVLTQAVERGRYGALFASAGLALGDFVQAVWTAVGVAALLASSTMAFQGIRYAGAAYLVFLGLKRLRKSHPSVTADYSGAKDARPARLVAQAFLTLNPKTTLFFLALFPQVIDVHTTYAWMNMLALGAVFAVFGFCTNFLFAFAGRSVAFRLVGNRDLASSARYVTAAALIGLGILAAVGK